MKIVELLPLQVYPFIPNDFYFFRSLADAQTKLGEEYILSAFPFENDKHAAMRVLQTVSKIRRRPTIFFRL